ELARDRAGEAEQNLRVVGRRGAQVGHALEADPHRVAGERAAVLRHQHAPAAQVEVDALRARRAESARVAGDETRRVRGGGRTDGGARRGARRDERRAGAQLELEDGCHDAEARAQVETERRGVEALLHEPHLRQAIAGELDGAFEQLRPAPELLLYGVTT